MSIRLQLTVWYGAVIGLTILLLCGGLWVALQHSILVSLDQELQARLLAIQHYLAEQQNENGETAEAQQEMAEDFDAVAGTALVRLTGPTGTWIFRSPGLKKWDHPLPPAGTLAESGTRQTIKILGHSIRLIAAPTPMGGVLQLGLPLDQFEHMQHLLALTVLVSSPFLIIFASVAGYWMSGRVLTPIHQVAITLRDIGANNLGARLPVRGTGDELDQLTDVINQMLTRLESAFTRITRFTSDASHELRTPVAIIKTTAEVEMMEPHAPAARAWGVVLKQIARAHALIDDLLLLARADTEPKLVPYELVNASAVVSEVCDEVSILADTAGLQLCRTIAPGCTFLGDAEDLRRILLMLIDNAIKYTQAPGVIEVSAGRSREDGELLLIAVRDTGSGISDTDLCHVFERFYRVARDRSRSTGGGGLGLAIASHLAERNRGSISVTSVLEKGSTFTLSLPFWSPPDIH